MKIDNFELQSFLYEALERKNINKLTEVQEKSIPKLLLNDNLIIKSKTGSGKTLAFLLPLINKIDPNEKNAQLLILAPTRELALQIVKVARELTEKVESYKVVPVIGGSDFRRQVDAIRKNSKIIIGTPGRVLDHIERKSLRLKHLKALVLDEADVMLDMGFRKELTAILDAINKDRQNVLCSATIDSKVNELIKTVGDFNDKVEIDSFKSDFIKQEYVFVHEDKKFDAFKELLLKRKEGTCIVFCNTIKMVDTINKFVKDLGLKSLALHGEMRQQDRSKAMKQIKEKEIDILIATDVASRGIDIEKVQTIINFDIPYKADSYIHRIGRSGRVGNDGYSVTIINKKPQLQILKEIVKITNNDIKELELSFSRDTKTGREKPKKQQNKKTENFKNKKTSTNNNKEKNKFKTKKFDKKNNNSKNSDKKPRKIYKNNK